jgi:transposase InsO family protein
MIVNLDTRRLKTLDEVRAFLAGSSQFEFTLTDRTEAYRWIEATLRQLGYANLGKADKGTLRAYLEKVTSFSRAQVTRLIGQFLEAGKIRDRRGAPARPFPRRYTAADVELLAEVDALHDTLSGPTTRKLCERAFEVFGDERYTRLAQISNGHLYNLRHSKGYQRRRQTFTKTRPTTVKIGERRKPWPDGKPGYLRIDSVHQGDFDGIKGLYHVNAVDEVTQWQGVFSVPRISERFLVPCLEALIQSFPFSIRGFHSDNGSEYVNHRVAELLNKLNIEFTKSRSRQTNDNALVESKNGSVVRKQFGYAHIPASYAEQVNQFAVETLTPYLNFHRPCFFPETVIDDKGRQRKRYPYQNLMTPYEKLKSIPAAKDYLKPDVTFVSLDAIAFAESDNTAARRLQRARAALFQAINSSRQSAS